jgi:hypothetical protein
MCRQSWLLVFAVIDAIVKEVVALVNDLMLLVSDEERAVTLDLCTVGYLRQDGANLGKVVEELLLLGKLVLAPPVLVELIGQEVEIRQLVKAVLLGYHGGHINERCGTVDACLFQLNGRNDGVGLEDKWEKALLGQAARGVDDEVKVFVTHGSDKVEGLLLTDKLGTGNNLIEGWELGPALTVLLMLLDDTTLWIGIEDDKTAMVFEDELTGSQHAVGGLAAPAFLVGEYNDLVASLLGALPNVEKWNVHKVGCWKLVSWSFCHLCYVRLVAA